MKRIVDKSIALVWLFSQCDLVKYLAMLRNISQYHFKLKLITEEQEIKREVMIYLELVFFILFAVCTVTGYRKNNRNLMLIGAFFSLIAFAVLQAIDGYKAGQSEVNASVSDMN